MLPSLSARTATYFIALVVAALLLAGREALLFDDVRRAVDVFALIVLPALCTYSGVVGVERAHRGLRSVARRVDRALSALPTAENAPRITGAPVDETLREDG